MAQAVRLPQFGPNMQECTLIRYIVAEGACVKKGDCLFEIETEKATVEVESPADGWVKKIFAEPGSTVVVDAAVLVLGDADEQISKDYINSLITEKSVSTRPPCPAEPEEEPEIWDWPGRFSFVPGAKVKLTDEQKLVAKNAVQSKRHIPCFYLNTQVNATKIVQLLETADQPKTAGACLTDFIIRAVAVSLKHYPAMTGQLDGDYIVTAADISVGLITETEDRLTGIVIDNADKKSIAQIAQMRKSTADSAKKRHFSFEDLKGACITLTSLGKSAVDMVIPIVIPGQCSIMGLGRLTKKALPDNGNIVPVSVFNLSIAVDHRVANGAESAEFLDFIRKILENTSDLL